MNRITRVIRSTNRTHPRRLDDLVKSWGETTGQAIFEYEASRHAHSHAMQRLAQEAQR
jgi:uncharacterized protein YbjQ (UPF0145 family)